MSFFTTCFCPKQYLLPGLLALAVQFCAQEVPRIYPVPTALDTARGAAELRDQQQFANPSVLGMGPSQGIIIRYEHIPTLRVRATSEVAGLGNYETVATSNARTSR